MKAVRPLVRIHWPTFIPLFVGMFLIATTVLWLHYIRPALIQRVGLVAFHAPIFPVDPASCAKNEGGWSIPDTCQRKDVFHPGDSIAFQYDVSYNFTCDMTFAPWLVGPRFTLGPVDIGGVHAGHPESPEGKFVSIARTLPLHTPSDTYKWQINTKGCDGIANEWSPPVIVTVVP